MTATDLSARLKHDIVALASIERPPASPGERKAARWVGGRLTEIGIEAKVEEFRFNPDYWLIWAVHGLAMALAAGLALVGPLWAIPGAVLGAATAVSLWAELAVKHRPLRRWLRPRTSYNVVGRIPNSDADRVLIISAHHDAPPSGMIHHPLISRVMARIAGPERDQQLPLGAFVVLAALICAAASARAAGLNDVVLSVVLVSAAAGAMFFVAGMLDIGRRRSSPGSNDDASGVAVMLALAEKVASSPLPGVEVWFVSTGSEEGILGGMEAFLARHGEELRRRPCLALNLEMVGAGRIHYLKSDGFLARCSYDAEAVALVEAVVGEPEFAHVRPLERAPFITDALLTTRQGIPSVTICSINDDGYVPHWHWKSDTPETVDLNSVSSAFRFCQRLTMSFAEKK